MWTAGLSYDIPSRSSITTLWERPMPSASRPPTAALVVRAWAANIIGWRG